MHHPTPASPAGDSSASWPGSGSRDACRPLPFTDAIPKALAASDPLVFPSTTDHLPRPVIEAGAMERPVVASRFPIVQEVVQHGKTGLVVPPSDPRALARAILAALGDEKRARALGAAGRGLVRERVEASGVAAAMTELYMDILARRRAGASRSSRSQS